MLWTIVCDKGDNWDEMDKSLEKRTKNDPRRNRKSKWTYTSKVCLSHQTMSTKKSLRPNGLIGLRSKV